MNPRYSDEFESIYGLKVAEMGEDHPHLNIAVKRACLNFLRKERRSEQLVSMPASRNYLDADIETILDLCLDEKERKMILAAASGVRGIDGYSIDHFNVTLRKIKGRYDFRNRLEANRERNIETARRFYASGSEDEAGQGEEGGCHDHARAGRESCAA